MVRVRHCGCAVAPNHWDGFGFVLTPADGIVGFDLDHCIDEHGTLADWANSIVARLDSYTEVSPSGSGVRVFCFGDLPPGRRKHGPVEVYDRDRFLTVTGRVLSGCRDNIEVRGPQIAEVHASVFPKRPEPERNGHVAAEPVDVDDQELLRRARLARNGAAFDALWRGDTAGYASHSEADLALCSILAFWTATDTGRMDVLFRQSGLMRPKWDELRGASTYGERTLAVAAMNKGDVYTAPVSDRHNGSRAKPATKPSKPASTKPQSAPAPPALPKHHDCVLADIVCNARPLPNITRDALAALVAANAPPCIFQRAKSLVRVVDDVVPLGDHTEIRPVIQSLSEPALRGELARSANWQTTSRKGGHTDCAPPIDVVRDLAALRGWPLTIPPLAGIVEAPSLRPDGSLILSPGYDSPTGVFYAPRAGLRVPAIPEQPTRADIEAALLVIEDLLGEFPFDGPSAWPNMLALLLTPLLRACLGSEAVPMAVLDAPKQGSGKSLLARVASVISTGQDAAAFSAPGDEAEWRKCITAIVRSGASLILIDNVDLTNWQGDAVPLRSTALSAVLTSSVHRDRILGASEMVELPARCTWALTGNNVSVGSDLIRRCYRIRVDPKVAQPWLRTGFRHPDLIDFVRQQRAVLLGALLTLCRAWFAAGCPLARSPVLGSFERWSKTVGGILGVAKVDGFLSDLAEMYATSDGDTPEWLAFLLCWQQTFGRTWLSIAEVVDALQTDQGHALRLALPSTLGEALERTAFPKRFGQALKHQVGVRYGESNARIEAAEDKHTKVRVWRVVADAPSP